MGRKDSPTITARFGGGSRSKAFIATVQEGVQGMKDGDIFRVQGLVSYKKRAVPQRAYRNPATGGEIVKPAHSVVKTSAPKAIKDLA